MALWLIFICVLVVIPSEWSWAALFMLSGLERFLFMLSGPVLLYSRWVAPCRGLNLGEYSISTTQSVNIINSFTAIALCVYIIKGSRKEAVFMYFYPASSTGLPNDPVCWMLWLWLLLQDQWKLYAFLSLFNGVTNLYPARWLLSLFISISDHKKKRWLFFFLCILIGFIKLSFPLIIRIMFNVVSV